MSGRPEPGSEQRSHSLLTGLDPDQVAAVTVPSQRTLVVAGPGAGKTRVLTHRVAWLIRNDGVAGRHIMTITFTNRAAGELRDRLDVLLEGDEASGMWVGTFHSVCARLLRRFGTAVGVGREFGIADADDVRRILRRLVTADGTEARAAARVADDVARAVSAAKNRLEDPCLLPDRVTANYAARYKAEMAAQHLVDFDDLLVGGVALLRHPEVGDLIRSRFTHVLVDEYQDTNVAQWEFLRLLAGSGGALFAVGDASQAIYGFRGSTPEAMESFTTEHPGAAVCDLGRNWRSSARIVAVGDAFGEKTGVSRRASLWTTAPPGSAPGVRFFDDDRDEAAAVASEIIAAGPPWEEKAVLVRTNAQTRTLEAALNAATIPYVVVGGTRFWDRAEVRDAMSWLRLASNPADVDAFARAATAPKRGLGARSVAVAREQAAAGGVPIGEWVGADGRVLPRYGAALASFADDLEVVKGAANIGPAAAVEAVLGITGFVDAVCRSAGRVDTAVDREANLDELRSASAAFTADDPSASGVDLTRLFCASASLMSASDSSGVGVRVSTVHAAKGREFDAVWVVGVEEGFFPHERSDGSEVDEECRLLFVAATRARHRLTFSWSESRMLGGKVLDREPSRFLALLSGLADRGDLDATPAALGVSRFHTGSNPSPSDSGFVAGMAVRHATFGEGRVVDVAGDTVKVDFAGRVRTLMASMAPMSAVKS